MKRLALLVAFVTPVFSLHAQNNYAAQWKTVDALIQKKNLPKSALALVNKIQAQAKTDGDEPQRLKALVYQTALQQETREGADSTAIAEVKKEKKGSREPYASIYSSLLAALYQRYFEAHRWQLRNRTAASTRDSTAISKWSGNDFQDKIRSLYLASLQPKEVLQKTPLNDFSVLIVKGNTAQLRPTLYDLLAQKALAYFENTEHYFDVSEYNSEFLVPELFAPAKTFAGFTFQTNDTTSAHYNALHIYQHLLAFHANDENKDALIDADIARIGFVYRNAAMKEKDSLYRQALNCLLTEYSGNKTVNQAGYLLAQHYNELSSSYRPFGDTAHRYERVKAKNILQKIIADSSVKNEGWTNAYNLLQEIRKPSLSVTVEKVNLPGEPFRALVKYKAVANVFGKLIRSSPGLQNALEGSEDDKYWEVLAKQKPIRSWQLALPATADWQEHSVEIKVDALPAGDYFLVLSDMTDIANNAVTAAANHLWVSTISYVSRDNDFFVLHRKTGEPLAGAAVELYDKDYNDKTSRYVSTVRGRYKTDAHGFFHAAEKDVKDYDSYLRFRYGAETLSMEDDVSLNRYTSNERTGQRETQVYFYTDRAIYRPGQTVRFKGIVVSKGQGADKSVVANQPLTVYLQDANGETRDSLKLVSNAYGSVADSFRLPVNLLNGTFSIRTQVGKQWSVTSFSVEEYKRPKFFVAFDRVDTTYKLGDSIRLTLRAKSYAGSLIGNAKVSYRIKRSQRWTWGRYSNSYPQQIAFDEKETDAEGILVVSFLAEADKTVDSSENPVFNYSVTATVTDINGETHSETETLSVGYAALILSASVPEKLPVDSFKTVAVQTENLQGAFAEAPLKITLFKLSPEARPLRKRYWERPDQFVMSKEEYRQHFPFDEYAAESNYQTWAKAAVDSFATKSNKEGKLALAWKERLQAGHYLLDITAKDGNGKEVKTEEHFELFDKSGSGKPEFLWTHREEKPLKPGEHLDVQLASAAKAVYLIKESDREAKSKRDTSRFTYERLEGKKTVRFDASEADRGGYSFGFLFVKENRVYQYNDFVSVPWSNKELTVSLTTFRDKTEPGAKETWKLKIKGQGGKRVAAEVLASMYDASLDVMQYHGWREPTLWESYHYGLAWADDDFRSSESDDKEPDLPTQEYKKEYDAFLFDRSKYGQSLWWLNPYAYTYNNQGEFYVNAYRMPPPPPTIETAKGIGFTQEKVMDVEVTANASRLMALPKPLIRGGSWKDVGFYGSTEMRRFDSDSFTYNIDAGVAINFDAGSVKAKASVQPRKNLSETAFFFPFLTTDENGDVEISFTAPEALTQWKLQTLAHTKDLAFGTMEQTLLTQKSLMAQPNVPRFVRQGDAFTLQAKISNLSDAELKGEARLQLFDAATNEAVIEDFGLPKTALPFAIKAGGSSVVNFPVSVPVSFNSALTWRITASAEGANNASFSDGEEATLPVLPEKIMLTESLPLVLKGAVTKEIRLEKLLQSGGSSTIRHQSLTVEATTNPAWYVVQSLPYLMEFPYECAEQTWNRYYANALASIIATSSPQAESLFAKWKKDTVALQSPLQKNEELKSALLQETPWLTEAKTEAAQKGKLGLLFDKTRIAAEISTNLAKLLQMQKSDGAFGWFPGGPNNRYITQYILTGIGRLLNTRGLNKETEKKLSSVVGRALAYLDKQIAWDAKPFSAANSKVRPPEISATEIQYLYMRSFFPAYALPKPTQAVATRFKISLATKWTKLSKQLQAMAALALYRSGDKNTPAAILASLKETAIVSEERGMYWKEVDDRRGFFWQEAPIETVALLIEAFAEAGKDEATVAALQTWLIQQKQTNHWGSTKATADACHAILLRHASVLRNGASVQINLGGDASKSITFTSDSKDAEEGTGYFKRTLSAEQIGPGLGSITVQAKSSANTAPVWVAVYWQYFESMDKATAAASPLIVRKELFIEKTTAKGAELFPITDTAHLKPGDKLKVRIQLITDRDLEYVHLKDLRASCLEPLNVLSGYRWQNGVGYYEETKDASTNFFFDLLPKGTHIFEYPVYVAQSGNFTGGIATAQCMYAPQIAAHSEGERLRIQ